MFLDTTIDNMYVGCCHPVTSREVLLTTNQNGGQCLWSHPQLTGQCGAETDGGVTEIQKYTNTRLGEQ